MRKAFAKGKFTVEFDMEDELEDNQELITLEESKTELIEMVKDELSWVFDKIDITGIELETSIKDPEEVVVEDIVAEDIPVVADVVEEVK